MYNVYGKHVASFRNRNSFEACLIGKVLVTNWCARVGNCYVRIFHCIVGNLTGRLCKKS